MTDAAAVAEKPRALIVWRLLSLLYDVWPVLAMWFVVAVPFVLVDVAASGNVRHNVEPFSLLAWLEWGSCWLVTGLYAVLSWRRGGQTLGMRPWRLKVVAADGTAPTLGALWRRFALATLSTLAGGLGFWWGWVDRDRLTFHDRFSGTRMIRLPKRR
ncbi:Uncharacterized membrane protein YckC, RDD family [Pseudoxanthomonas sp. CF385]|uniref:RDD family protein n=1 Tax=Pseudoxanthomonas sp. CF385 TaxID=1881042 RepID=UPI0008826146|nr:RDD family protein [Pseudoxanthomonas sp. CF385]SDQ38239.1 Uncharacterized membrane protein YckC, RDD family [Pseudoxanthomonas sp. CF385]